MSLLYFPKSLFERLRVYKELLKYRDPTKSVSPIWEAPIYFK